MQRKKILQFLGFVVRDYPKQFALLVIFIFMSSAFELLGFVTLFPIVGMFVDPSGATSQEYQYISAISSHLGLPVRIEFLYLVLVVVFLLKGGAVFLTEYYQQKIRIYTNMDLRSSIYEKVFQADWPFFIRKKVGDLSNITITQTKNAAVGIKHIAQLIVSTVFVVALLIASLAISWRIVLLAAVTSLLAFGLVNSVFKASHVLGKRIGLNENKINQIAVNSFTAPKHIKGSALEDFFAKWFGNVVDEAKSIEVSYAKITSLLVSMSEPISVITGVLILFISLTYFEQSLEQVILLVLMFYRLYQKVAVLPKAYAGVLYYLPLYQMCRSLRDEAERAKEVASELSFSGFEETIELRDVSFSYITNTPVIAEIDLGICKGEFIGITGKSGGGKTTLVDLILGLLRPTEGALLVDGIPLAEYDVLSWRKKIGYVCQDNALYNLSIMENIALGYPQIDQEEMVQVATMAHAHEFIQQLPDGYNTVVGERGITLSGGQRQRIALAQALYRKPEILILDEATSNLDSESEALIQQSINNLYGSMTIIAIAHRLKTIEHADRIVVIEGGRIIEEGSKDELTQRNGVLRQLIAAGNISLQ